MFLSTHQGSRRVIPFLLLAAICAAGGVLATPARAAPPSNDMFANALLIDTTTLPFSQTLPITEATQEPGEFFYCSYSYQTVWYRLAPAADQWLQVSGGGQIGVMAVYRDNGGGIGGLFQLQCSSGGSLTLLARGGTVYYLQAGAYCCFVQGSISVNVQATTPPAPVVEFGWNPGDPSSYDMVQFYDQSYDPAGQGIASRVYDFGDGGGNPDTTSYYQHRFSADGDYTVRLTVATTDGRTGSVTHVVHVRTHDVGITDFRTPQSAHTGQTKSITVSVSNTRYPEVVRVSLLKGLPGSYTYYQTVGTLEQYVPVRNANRSTDFGFNYTVSPDDVKLGKLIFKTVAELVGARDAFSADNEALSPLLRINSPGPIPYGEEFFQNQGLAFAIVGVLPNPAPRGGDMTLRFTLATEGAVSIQLLDVAGRVVTEQDLGVLPAGAHDARVTPATHPPAGIYWMRLTEAGQGSRVSRIAILD